VNYRIEGKPVLDLTRSLDRQRLEEVLALADTVQDPAGRGAMENQTSIRRHYQGKRIITDDNMGAEWSRRSDEDR